ENDRSQPGRAVQEPREDRQDIGPGLPAAALGGADQVVTLEDDGNGAALNGGRLGKSGSANALQERSRQAKGGKRHESSMTDEEWVEIRESGRDVGIPTNGRTQGIRPGLKGQRSLQTIFSGLTASCRAGRRGRSRSSAGRARGGGWGCRNWGIPR